MDLGHRGRGQWFDIKAAEHLADLRTELFFDQRHGVLRIERRYPVLQQHQLVGDVFGEQVATG
ncbi:hypothetical protein D3C78_930730 [compost metagenome]